MEDETGYSKPVTPGELWDALADHKPRMLFLSGCNTGKGHGDGSTESFAYQMVEKGIPVVLGWGLQVSDSGATLFTEKLYRALAAGIGIGDALQRARKAVGDTSYHPWPLLRIFTDGTAANAYCR
ncbi:MAG: CHAT domain-containing protein [Nitrospirae bacterium]|nr:CHAT domain-containing protein [Nitrospirota bacterium]